MDKNEDKDIGKNSSISQGMEFEKLLHSDVEAKLNSVVSTVVDNGKNSSISQDMEFEKLLHSDVEAKLNSVISTVVDNGKNSSISQDMEFEKLPHSDVEAKLNSVISTVVDNITGIDIGEVQSSDSAPSVAVDCSIDDSDMKMDSEEPPESENFRSVNEKDSSDSTTNNEDSKAPHSASQLENNSLLESDSSLYSCVEMTFVAEEEVEVINPSLCEVENPTVSTKVIKLSPESPCEKEKSSLPAVSSVEIDCSNEDDDSFLNSIEPINPQNYDHEIAGTSRGNRTSHQSALPYYTKDKPNLSNFVQNSNIIAQPEPSSLDDDVQFVFEKKTTNAREKDAENINTKKGDIEILYEGPVTSATQAKLGQQSILSCKGDLKPLKDLLRSQNAGEVLHGGGNHTASRSKFSSVGANRTTNAQAFNFLNSAFADIRLCGRGFRLSKMGVIKVQGRNDILPKNDTEVIEVGSRVISHESTNDDSNTSDDFVGHQFNDSDQHDDDNPPADSADKYPDGSGENPAEDSTDKRTNSTHSEVVKKHLQVSDQGALEEKDSEASSGWAEGSDSEKEDSTSGKESELESSSNQEDNLDPKSKTGRNTLKIRRQKKRRNCIYSDESEDEVVCLKMDTQKSEENTQGKLSYMKKILGGEKKTRLASENGDDKLLTLISGKFGLTQSPAGSQDKSEDASYLNESEEDALTLEINSEKSKIGFKDNHQDDEIANNDATETEVEVNHEKSKEDAGVSGEKDEQKKPHAIKDNYQDDKISNEDATEMEVTVNNGESVKHFIDDQAELSGEDHDGEEENEDDDEAKEEDLQHIDDSEKFDTEQLREQVAAVHAKQMKKEEENELKVLKECFVEDADLLPVDQQRKKKFKWNCSKEIECQGQEGNVDDSQDESDEDKPGIIKRHLNQNEDDSEDLPPSKKLKMKTEVVKTTGAKKESNFKKFSFMNTSSS